MEERRQSSDMRRMCFSLFATGQHRLTCTCMNDLAFVTEIFLTKLSPWKINFSLRAEFNSRWAQDTSGQEVRQTSFLERVCVRANLARNHHGSVGYLNIFNFCWNWWIWSDLCVFRLEQRNLPSSPQPFPPQQPDLWMRSFQEKQLKNIHLCVSNTSYVTQACFSLSEWWADARISASYCSWCDATLQPGSTSSLKHMNPQDISNWLVCNKRELSLR